MGKDDVRIIQEFPSHTTVRALPKVTIRGKLYFRDDRLEEFRRMDRPGDRPIKFEELGAYATGEEVRAIFGTEDKQWESRTLRPTELMEEIEKVVGAYQRGKKTSATALTDIQKLLRD